MSQAVRARPYLNPYVAGTLLGIVLFLAFLQRPLGTTLLGDIDADAEVVGGPPALADARIRPANRPDGTVLGKPIAFELLDCATAKLGMKNLARHLDLRGGNQTVPDRTSHDLIEAEARRLLARPVEFADPTLAIENHDQGFGGIQDRRNQGPLNTFRRFGSPIRRLSRRLVERSIYRRAEARKVGSVNNIAGAGFDQFHDPMNRERVGNDEKRHAAFILEYFERLQSVELRRIAPEQNHVPDVVLQAGAQFFGSLDPFPDEAESIATQRLRHTFGGGLTFIDNKDFQRRAQRPRTFPWRA